MSHYAIGDIQGCYTELMQLLEKIHFNEHEDILWLTGDIINGGPDNVAVLRFMTHLPKKPVIVLGNHDLHFLAVFYHIRSLQPDDTFEDILQAPDAEILCHWLQSQPLAHYDAQFNTLMVHAGVSPNWTLEQTLHYAREIETCLNPNNSGNPENTYTFLRAIFGTSEEEKTKHWRLITDTLTRIRFCNKQGELNLTYKGNIANAPKGLYPWFQLRRQSDDLIKNPDILFGHWAALEGKIKFSQLLHLYPLDTGCVWGGKLSALRLEDKQLFQVTGKKYR